MSNIDGEQKWRHRLVNWLCCSAGFTALVSGLAQLVAGNASLAGTGLAAGLLLLMAGTIERFELLKGLGLEAKVSRKLDEADAVLTQVKSVTEIAGTTLMQLVSLAGRWDGVVAAQEAYDLSRSIKRMLEAAGAADSVVRSAMEPWVRTAATDLTISVLAPYYEAIHKSMLILQSDVRESVQRYSTDTLKDWRKLPLRDFTSRLRAIARDVPAYVDSKVADHLRADVDEWAPSIDHLTATFELADPVRDIRRIQWQIDNRVTPWG